MKSNQQNYIFKFLYILFVFSCYLILLNTSYIYKVVNPVVVKNQVFLFADFSAIIAANFCENNNINPFISNPCDILQRKHVYGSILLLLPTDKTSLMLYDYFPYVLIMIFLITTVSFLEIKKENFLINTTALLTPTTLLMIERLNIDILIGIFFLILCLTRNRIFASIIISFLSLIKIYPIIFIKYFFSKYSKLKYSLIFSVLNIILLATYIYYDFNNFKYLLINLEQFTSKGMYAFGLSSIPNFLKNYFKVNIVIGYLIVIAVFLVSCFLINKFFYKEKHFNINIDENIFKDRLFINSLFVIFVLYLIFPNIYYREIFFLYLIPFLQNNWKNNLYISHIKKILTLKFLLLILILILADNFFYPRLYNLILLKHTLDIFIMIFLSPIIFNYTKEFIFKKIYDK